MQRGINRFARYPKHIDGTRWIFTYLRKAQLATLTLVDCEGETLANHSWWSYRCPSEDFLELETISMSLVVDNAIKQKGYNEGKYPRVPPVQRKLP